MLADEHERDSKHSDRIDKRLGSRVIGWESSLRDEEAIGGKLRLLFDFPPTQGGADMKRI
jgi:hypothetical protein